MKLLVLFTLAALGAAQATSDADCIVGCKCNDNHTSARIIQVSDCDSPLVLSNTTFDGTNKKMGVISFKNVIIQSIEGDAFKSLDNLEHFSVEDSSIESMDDSAFELQFLMTVSFKRTTFKQPPKIRSENVEELIFFDCHLTKIPDLEGVPNLQMLNLDSNEIKTVDGNTMSQVEGILELVLSNNRISSIPNDVFNNNTDLNTLNLDYNPLTSFQISSLSSLECLSLKYCKLTEFDRGWTKNLDLVTDLDLSNNQISVLPIDAFDGMTSLNSINLSNNNLVELDDNIFEDNLEINKIILDNNPFKNLPKFRAANDKKLKTYYFSCNNCSLESIDNSFDNMPGLLSLFLSNNKLSSIDGIFSNIGLLLELNLSNNSISTITAESFTNNKKLKILNLSGNPLKPLDPVVFTNLGDLGKMDIRRNNMTQLWSNHNAVIPSLQRILLSKNQITTLSVSDLRVVPNLRLLDLKNNPLLCNEDLRLVIEYINNNTIYPVENETHESLIGDAFSFDTFDPEAVWKRLVYMSCFHETPFEVTLDSLESKKVAKVSSTVEPDAYYMDNYEDWEQESEEIQQDNINVEPEDEDVDNVIPDDDATIALGPIVIGERNIALARASYILSITSVFVLSALVVLTLAVALTLFFLKRNGSLKMHNNLPRFKIPVWHTTSAEKKHCGSVYKTLTEDVSDLRTPIINRYEFKQTPQVHNNAIP